MSTTAACTVYHNDLVSIINFVKRRLRQQIVPVLPTVPGQEGVLPLAEDTFEGSYVAVSKPGKGTVHIVNGRGGSPLYGTGTRISYSCMILIINKLHNIFQGEGYPQTGTRITQE